MAERLGIVGFGIVGSAVANGFHGYHPIRIYDKFKQGEVGVREFKGEVEDLETVVDNSDILFVCLPTPMNDEGIDLSIIDESVDRMSQLVKGSDKIIVIKSTVVPGTTRGYSEQHPGLQFAFNPEFLKEASYLDDFLKPDRNVVGADNTLIRRRVGALYQDRFPGSRLFLTDPTTAEVVKYFANCVLPCITMIANEFYDICEALGVKFDEVRDMTAADYRLTRAPLKVTSERGFGGKCFPKDMQAMIGSAEELGVNVSVLEAVWDKNLRIRKTRDWEEIPGAVTDGANYTKG